MEVRGEIVAISADQNLIKGVLFNGKEKIGNITW